MTKRSCDRIGEYDDEEVVDVGCRIDREEHKRDGRRGAIEVRDRVGEGDMRGKGREDLIDLKAESTDGRKEIRGIVKGVVLEVYGMKSHKISNSSY